MLRKDFEAASLYSALCASDHDSTYIRGVVCANWQVRMPAPPSAWSKHGHPPPLALGRNQNFYLRPAYAHGQASRHL
jgi:hypothetical protein